MFVVGAAKSGTTALYAYFKAHPHVFVSPSLKEANYMAFYGGMPPLVGPGDRQCVGGSITTLPDYQRLYAARANERIAADVSPAYLYYPHAAAKIAELAPRAKIVIVLRNPVECVLSMYSMMRRNKREPCKSLLEAFGQSERRLADGWEWAWDYKNCFKFSAQVAGYLTRFPRRQLFVRRYEDLQEQPERFYRDLTAFLGVSMIDLERSNERVNTAPRRIDMMYNNRFGRLACRVGRRVGRIVPARLARALQQKLEATAFTLSPRERRTLVDHFGADILELSRLLDWDLRDWVRG